MPDTISDILGKSHGPTLTPTGCVGTLITFPHWLKIKHSICFKQSFLSALKISLQNLMDKIANF